MEFINQFFYIFIYLVVDAALWLVLQINSLKDLYLLLDEENLTGSAHQAADAQPLSPTIKSSAVSSTLADLRVALQDLSGELRQEKQGSQELTQQFAKAKASWEVERAELKNLISQVSNTEQIYRVCDCLIQHKSVLKYPTLDEQAAYTETVLTQQVEL